VVTKRSSIAGNVVFEIFAAHPDKRIIEKNRTIKKLISFFIETPFLN
jgi:hypothetical protein